MEQLTPEKMRLRILKILDASRSIAVGEELLLRVLFERQLHPTHKSLREHLEFLLGEELITMERRGVAEWQPRISERGVAMLQGLESCPIGVEPPGR